MRGLSQATCSTSTRAPSPPPPTGRFWPSSWWKALQLRSRGMTSKKNMPASTPPLFVRCATSSLHGAPPPVPRSPPARAAAVGDDLYGQAAYLNHTSSIAKMWLEWDLAFGVPLNATHEQRMHCMFHSDLFRVLDAAMAGELRSKVPGFALRTCATTPTRKTMEATARVPRERRRATRRLRLPRDDACGRAPARATRGGGHRQHRRGRLPTTGHKSVDTAGTTYTLNNPHQGASLFPMLDAAALCWSRRECYNAADDVRLVPDTRGTSSRTTCTTGRATSASRHRRPRDVGRRRFGRALLRSRRARGHWPSPRSASAASATARGKKSSGPPRAPRAARQAARPRARAVLGQAHRVHHRRYQPRQRPVAVPLCSSTCTC